MQADKSHGKFIKVDAKQGIDDTLTIPPIRESVNNLRMIDEYGASRCEKPY